MIRTFSPNVGSLMVSLFMLLSGALYAQNLTPVAGSTQTIFVPSSGYTSFSDPGGPGGVSIAASGCSGITGTAANDYPNCGCSTIVTVCHDVPGTPVEINVTEFSIFANFDYMKVYDGNSTSGTVLYNNGSGGAQDGQTCGGPGLIVPTNPTGCVTIEFYASTVVEDAGFIALINAGPVGDNDAGVVITAPTSPTTATPQNVTVDLKNFGALPLNSATIDWTINGVAQTPVNFTGPAIASSGSASLTLGNYTPASGDIIRAWSSLPNGVADTINVNDTSVVQLCIGLTGTFTINAGQPTGGTNFATFQEAVDTMAFCGIAGPIVFNVVPGSGPYTEQVTIPEITGASATNTITFNGNGDTLQFGANTSNRFVLRLDGADFVTIDSLYVLSQNATFGYGILLSNEADNNTIRKSTIDVSLTTSTTGTNSGGIVFSNSTSSNTTTGNSGNNNLIENNTIIGGFYGIRTNSGGSINNQYLNNILRDYYSYGIYISADNNNTLIEGNDISRPTRSTVTTHYGIYFTGVSLNCVTNANRIYNTSGGAPTSTSANYGIYHSSVDATDGNEHIVSNNLIYNINNNGIAYAIYNSSSDEIKYLHNTVAMVNTSSTTSSAFRGFYQLTTASGLDLLGNIFYLSRTGSGTHTGIYMGTSTTTFTSNYNVVTVAAPTATNDFGFVGSAQNTLADWQAATFQDANSYAIDPLFANIATADFTPGNPTFNNVVPNQGIAEDIFGNARGTNTDPGAIEFSGVPNDIGVFSFTAPTLVVSAGVQNVDVEIRNFGTNTVNSFDIGWTLNGTVQTPASSSTAIAPSNNSAPIGLGSYTPTGRDTIVAWTSNPNGTADAFQANDTLIITTCIGMAGTYTIDANNPTGGTNFASYAAAVDSMVSCGIVGPVVFNVVPGSGPYVEQVVIPLINGVSPTNTITFNGSGDTIQFNASATAAKYVVQLNGAQYVTFDSVYVYNLGGTFGIGIQLTNNAQNNIIENSTVDVLLNSSTTAGNSAAIAISGGTTSTGNATFTGSNNIIRNNELIGGYQTVSIFGATDGTGADGNQIIDNIIRDFNNAGVLLGDNSNTIVKGNDISRPTRSSVTTFHGVELEANVFGALVDANAIHNTHGGASSLTSAVYGIYFTSSDADSARLNIVSNNLVYDINSNGIVYGIYSVGSNNNRIYNNTIVIDDQNATTTSACRGFFQTTAAENVHVKNNIFYVTRTGTTAKYGVYLGTTTSDITLDNNVYYINSPTSTNFIGYYSIGYDSLSNWQTANTGNYDLNSFVRNPRFVDPANDDYTPASAVINDQAEPLAEVTTDFFGAPRSATPDPGAIEFVPAADDAATIALLNPAAPFAPGNYPITVDIQNLGTADITEVQIYVNINDGVNDTTLPVFNHNPVLIPSIAHDTVTIGSFDFVGGPYTVTIWTANPNGANDANNTNDTIVVNLCLALPAGNYTINSALPTGSGNYNSFNDAVAALACGILGDVTFTVATGSGPYSEQVSIGEVPGSSATSTITFDGQGETLTHDGSVKFATLLLAGTDYVTVNNLIVESTSSAQGFGIQLTSQADHNTIKNSTISMSTSTTNTSNYGIVASASETSATAEGNNANYLLIDSVTVIGGYRGIGLEGIAGTLLKANRITNSTLLQQFNAAVWVDDMDSIILHNNYVDSLRDQTNGDGFYLFDLNGYFEITENIVTAPDWGMYINDANTADSTRRAKVVNNMVRSNTEYGLYFVTASHVDVWHNTVVGNSAIYLTSNTQRMDIRNNIFYSTGDYAFEDAVAVGTSNHVAVNYNLYFSGSPSLFIRQGGTTTAFDYADLAAWQTAAPSFNVNSLVGDPVFVGNDDLHILGVLPNDAGDNTVGVTIDIDGDTRPAGTSVDIGADEYTPFTSNIELTNIIAPANNSCGDSSALVTVIIYNLGTQAQGGFDIQVDVTGDATTTLTTTYAGPIAPQTFDTVVVGTLNTHAGGNFNLFAQLLLATDQFTQNDSFSTSISVLGIPAAPTAVGDTGCVGDFLELTADLTGFIDLQWYDDPSLTTSVGDGEIFFTPALNSSATYYVVGSQGLFERAGKPAATGTSSFITATAGWGLEFEVTQTVVLDSVTIYPTGTGTISLAYYDLNAGNTVVATSAPVNVSGSGASTPVQIYVGWTIDPGTYNIGIDAYSGITNLIRDSGGNTFPYGTPSGNLTVTAGKTSFTGTTTSSYYWFYDWVVRIPGCTSPPAAVTAFISDTQSDAGADQTICAGDTATLEALNGDSWLWTGGANTQTVDVTPAATTTYTLTVVDEFGCTATPDQVTVIVNQLPNVTVNNDTAICDGASVALGALGADTYVWSTNETTAIITATTAGIYTVTGTDVNGCVNTDSVEVTVRPLPSGNAGADEEICIGGSAQLLATGGFSYLWSTNETTAAITVNPASTTDYTLTTTDQFGCVGNDTVTVVVNALPVLDITVGDTICISQGIVALTATPAGGTFSGPGVSNGEFDPTLVGIGTYNIGYSYTDGNGCSNSTTKQVVVDGSTGCTPGVGSLAGLQIGGVYPNPFQDEVTIEFTATSNEPVSIRMYDLLGQTIFEAEVEVTYGLNTFTIDTDRSLAEGFYVIELRKGEQSYLEKLLRVR